MKRVLITGINGFTGRYMCQEMSEAGWQVWGLGTQTTCEFTQNYQRADLLDLEGLEQSLAYIRPDAVIHLAGIASPAHHDVCTIYRANIEGTRNLLSAIHVTTPSIECVLLASSAYVYGIDACSVLTESSPLLPGNDYAVSKLAMELMARLWLDKLPIVFARPFNYTGVGQSESFLIPKIVAHFRHKADVIELGNLDVSRDFSDVRSVVKAYRRLLETRPIGQTVNVCSGVATSLRQVLALMQGISGHAIQTKLNPAFVRANDVKELRGDSSKLMAIIGDWSTPPLGDTLKWMLEA